MDAHVAISGAWFDSQLDRLEDEVEEDSENSEEESEYSEAANGSSAEQPRHVVEQIRVRILAFVDGWMRGTPPPPQSVFRRRLKLRW